MDELESKDNFLDAHEVMTEFYWNTAAFPELIVVGKQQNGRLQIKEQEMADKMNLI